MAEYTVTKTAKMVKSRFAIGRNTGTLYFMLDGCTGYVVAGRGEMRGKEGHQHRNDPHLFDAVPVGAKIELTV